MLTFGKFNVELQEELDITITKVEEKTYLEEPELVRTLRWTDDQSLDGANITIVAANSEGYNTEISIPNDT